MSERIDFANVEVEPHKQLSQSAIVHLGSPFRKRKWSGVPVADLIRLIIRDEAVHGYYIGYKFQKGLEETQGTAPSDDAVTNSAVGALAFFTRPRMGSTFPFRTPARHLRAALVTAPLPTVSYGIR